MLNMGFNFKYRLFFNIFAKKHMLATLVYTRIKSQIFKEKENEKRLVLVELE